MALSDNLISIKPGETSGPRSHNRFDYQSDWALCHLLDLHQAGQDYVIIFDYHDDVLVLDSASAPQTVVFYQIKSRGGRHWTRADLTKCAKGAKSSIVGKLYGHITHFADATRELCFVSNANYSVRRQHDKKPAVCQSFRFADLHLDEQSAILTCLERELSEPPLPGRLLLFCCKHSDLGHEGHVDQALGRLIRFIEALPGTEQAQLKSVHAFFRTLKGEISRRSTHEGEIEDYDGLCRLRAIRRNDFDKMLDKVKTAAPPINWPEVIRNRLTLEQVPFAVVTRIVNGAMRYIAESFSPTNTIVLEAANCVRERVNSVTCQSLMAAIEGMYAEVVDLKPVTLLATVANEDYLRGMIGVLLYEAQELPPVNSHAQDPSL